MKKKHLILFIILQILSLQIVMAQSLSGTYTIGGTSPDYTSFSSAISDLNSNGISDSVTFNVRTGIYYESLVLSQINGANAIKTITFKSETNNPIDVTIYKNFGNAGSLVTFDTASYYIFKHIKFKCKKSSYGDLVKSVTINGNSNNLEFHNNIFEHQNMGNYNYGIFSNGSPENTIISNNTFNKCYYALRISNGENQTINNNTFYLCDKIFLTSIDNLSFNGNSSYYNTELFFYFCKGDLNITKNNANKIEVYSCTTDTIGIINNMAYYLDLHNSNNVSIYFNTFRLLAEINITDTISIKNNIFNSILKFNNVGNNFESDYNIFNSTIEWSGVSYSLANYKALTQADSNSYYLTPDFVSNNDLHINYGAFMHNLGTPVNNVIDDIDEDTRSTISPDIGADEFDIPNYDLKVFELANPNGNPCQGQDSISIRLVNAGSSTITSFYVNCQINDSIMPSYLWNGLLNTADTSSNIWVCNYIFSLDSSYTVKIWTSAPNGNPDQNNTNDTIINNLYTRIQGGSYTVEGVNPDYGTLTEAINDLKLRGICGSVTFNIRSGTYTNYDYYKIPEILGNTTTDTIVIQAESGNMDVILRRSTSSNWEIFDFDGVCHITLKNLTLEKIYYNGTGSRIITSEHGPNSSTINLFHNKFKSEYNFLLVNSEQATILTLSGYDKAVLKDNIFELGTIGLVSTVDSLYMINNTFINQWDLGLKVTYADTFLFAYNIVNIANVSNFQGLSTIVRNSKNINFHHNYVGSTLFEECDGMNGWNKIYNNVFFDSFFRFGFSNDDYDEEATLKLAKCDSIELCNNTIVCNVQDAGSRNVPAFYASGISNVKYYQKWLNNNFVNHSKLSKTNKACKISMNMLNIENDYNNIFSLHMNDSSLITGHNICDNPNFVDTNFHHFTPELNNVGTPVSYITDDIDNELRNSLHPDIGADEYDVVLFIGNDTTLCAHESILLDAGSGFNSYSWSNGSTSQTTLIDTTGNGLGITSVRVDVTDAGNSFYDVINITFNICSNINKTVCEKIAGMEIYPNPTGDFLNIKTKINREGILFVSTLNGQEIFKTEIRDKITKIDIEHLPKGIYLIKFVSEDFVGVKKIIKQ